MKFSIITPSYNQVQYLPTCLRSVGMQTHRDLEHIVVDGGSKDGSQNVLRDFQARDSRLHFTSGPDKGQGDAINKGFAAATGDIIAWINSDDYYFSPLIFEHVAAVFVLHPEVDLIYGGMAWVDSEDNLLHVRIPPRFNWAHLSRIAYIGNTNSFYRRAVIQRHQIDLRHHFVLDHEYMLRVTRDFKAMRTSLVLACFRTHPAAKTQTMHEAEKNAERQLRDADLGIVRSRYTNWLTWLERGQYRLELAVSDFCYIRKWKHNPPYREFLSPGKS